MKLSKYVKSYRLEHNLSQYDMALKSELSQSVISLVESGKFSHIGYRTVRKLAKGLDLEVEEVRKML